MCEMTISNEEVLKNANDITIAVEDDYNSD